MIAPGRNDRVYIEPSGETPKEYYIYAIVGAASTLAGALTVAWRNFNFVLESWQWGALVLSPFIGAIIMFAIMTRKQTE